MMEELPSAPEMEPSAPEFLHNLDHVNELVIGLKWDMFDVDNKVDLDASCVFFDMFGRIQNAIYYNQLNIGYAIHSGDNTTGEGEGYDEIIRIFMGKLDPEIESFMIVINCHSGGNFTKVETAEAHLLDGNTGQQLAEIFIGCQGEHTALLFCVCFKDEGTGGWFMKQINRTCNGKHFNEVEREMKEELRFIVPEELAQEMLWDAQKSSKRFDMSKGDVIRLIGLEKVIMGLGWDTHCDLDASVIEVKKDFSFGEIVYYRHLNNKNKSIIHFGDNLTGVGEGDDEVIEVDLTKLDSSVRCLVFIVNVYTWYKTFGDVKGAYCRLFQRVGAYSEKKEVCRFNLSDRKGGKAMVMCVVYRTKKRGHWKIKSVGESVEGRTAKDSRYQVLPFVPGYPKGKTKKLKSIKKVGKQSSGSSGSEGPSLFFCC